MPSETCNIRTTSPQPPLFGSQLGCLRHHLHHRSASTRARASRPLQDGCAPIVEQKGRLDPREAGYVRRRYHGCAGRQGWFPPVATYQMGSHVYSKAYHLTILARTGLLLDYHPQESWWSLHGFSGPAHRRHRRDSTEDSHYQQRPYSRRQATSTATRIAQVFSQSQGREREGTVPPAPPAICKDLYARLPVRGHNDEPVHDKRA